MIVYLVELLPAAKGTGVVTAFRYSSSPLWTRADGLTWLPRLSVPYRRSIQVFDGSFSSQPQDYGSIEVRMQTGDLVSPVIGMAWDGRRCRVWKGAPGLPTAQMQLLFDGDCDSVEGTKQGFKVNLRGPGFKLTQNMLTNLYDGSGDAEGTSDLANTPVPMLLGTAVDVPATYVDKSRGIFQYHGYGVGSLQGVYDGGSALAFDGHDYADYASLKAAVVAAGYYSTCNALGMGRHGGPSITNLAVDAAGLAPSGTMGDIMTALGGLAGVPVRAATVTWFNANLAYPQDNYISEQTTYDAVLRDMLLKLGGYLCWTPDGQMSAGLVRRGGGAVAQLGRQNIASATIRSNSPPYYRRRMGYQRAWKVHSLADVRTPKEVNPRGTYAAGTAYAYYDLVNYGVDTWLHIGTDPTTGTAPAEGAVWTRFGIGVTKTSQLTDDASLGLTALWPSVAGTGKPADYADVTAQNTAASITGQGTFATKSSVDRTSGLLTGFGAMAGLASAGYGSSYLTGFGALSPLGSISFGSPYLLETSGGAQAVLAAFKTIQGIAASITGQGAFATVNSAAYGSSLLTGFNTLASLAQINLGQHIFRSDGSTPLTDALAVTSLGTAAALAGQGALATLSYVGASRYQGATNNIIPDPDFDDLPGCWTYPAGWYYEAPSGSNGTASAGLPASLTIASAVTGSVLGSTTARWSLSPGQSQRFRATVNNKSNQPFTIVVNASADPSGYSAQDYITLTWAAGESGTKEAQGTVPGGKPFGKLYFYFANSGTLSGYLNWGATALTPASTAAMIAPQAVKFGTTVWRPDGTTATDAGYYTASGIASAVTGQGALATAPQISGSNVLSYFNASAFQLNYSITRADGTSIVTENLAITSLGIASAVSGQGALATKSQVGVTDIAPSSVQLVSYQVLQASVSCPVGN